ncbi:site-specific integrase [Asticcacaulis solisilvae]|uniref:site-specific integrase n=1 Tax=Asticcacaulis solisilvae TaxID=1217274 RepID=UPI003FD8C7B0
MGTIVPRKRKNGTTAYHAQVLIKRDGRIAYRETRTFERKAAASAWIDKTEEALLNPRALDEVRQDDPPLRSVIERYMAESKKAMGRTKKQVLNTLKDEHEIADMLCSAISSADITSLATDLGRTRQPATVANYLSHLGAVFAIARAAWRYPLDPAVMKDGHLVAKKLGLTGKGKERDRRPTLAELNIILTHYQAREREVEMLPMTKIVPFAVFSTRRQEEIVSIRWPDLDEDHSRVLIRDMKSPTEKVGNNVWVDIPPEAMKIIKSMPRIEDRIFPYTTDAISASFTRACQFLGIEDLHFHDLRHDGISRLFELGDNIPHVATVSGHRSWQSLKRYTHIRQSGDKYKGWPWLRVATAPLEPKSPYLPKFKPTKVRVEAQAEAKPRTKATKAPANPPRKRGRPRKARTFD